MENPVAERIKFLVTSREKGNKSAFGRTVGISSQAVSDVLETKGGPSFPVLQKILKAYPDISSEWLIFGEGEMLKGQQPEATDPVEALHKETGTLLKLAVTEAMLKAAQEENARLYDLLGKPTSSPDAARFWYAPLAASQGRQLAYQRG